MRNKTASNYVVKTLRWIEQNLLSDIMEEPPFKKIKRKCEYVEPIIKEEIVPEEEAADPDIDVNAEDKPEVTSQPAETNPNHGTMVPWYTTFFGEVPAGNEPHDEEDSTDALLGATPASQKRAASPTN